MSADTIDRKYVLTKIDRGDYLLLANDGVTLWRIRTYEDGPSHGLQVDWQDRTFWGCWKLRGQMVIGRHVTPDDWDWTFWEGMHDTRAEAIQAALKANEGSS